MSTPNSRREYLLATLRQHAEQVRRSEETFRHSIAQCEAIGVKEQYSLEELDQFEALSSRFARTTDLLTQKLLKTLLLVLGEEAISFGSGQTC